MPFPYAYYKEEYNGPLHGTDLEAPVLKLRTAKSVTTADLTSGVLDVTGKSVISVSTTLGNATINSIVGGVDGQLLLIRKVTSANSLTLTYNFGGAGEVVTAHGGPIVLGNGRYGGAALIYTGSGWHHIDNTGYFANGTALAPAIAFASDTNSGIFSRQDNVVSVATNGIERFFVAITSIESLTNHRFIDGTVSLPAISFSSDNDTGFFKTALGLGFSGDGIERVLFNKTGEINLSNPSLKSDSIFGLFTTSNAAQKIHTGGLLSSDTYADSALIPVNGIYSKGHVKTAGQFQGTATSANYADLAERYEADAIYPPGTIVDIGGDKEITIAHDPSCFGIISTAPGFKMNSEAGSDDTHPYVALAGKVPCRVIGKVKKGQRIIVSRFPGVGNAVQFGDGSHVIGRALENKDTEEEGLVMIVTRAII